MPQDIPSGDYDARLDALEAATSNLRGTIERMKTPFWKRWSFLGSTLGVVLVATGWLWSHFEDDPEIPRMVHSNILMSDKALALTIKRGIAGDGSVSPLVQQIGKQVDHHLKTDEVAREYLFDVAALQGIRTWSAARLFKRQPVVVGSVRCRLLADPLLWESLVSISPDTPEARHIARSCSGGGQGGGTGGGTGAGTGGGEGTAHVGERLAGPDALRSVAHFADFSPMILPFQAEAGDAVELDIRILAQRQIDEDTLVEISDAHDFVEATLFPAADITFDPPVRRNRLTQRLELAEGESAQVLAITLSDEGQSKVQGPDGAGDFYIYLFATVTVIPKPRL